MTAAALAFIVNSPKKKGLTRTPMSTILKLINVFVRSFHISFQTAKKSGGGSQVASAGNSASRSTAKQGRRSVKLSHSQVAIAKRLGVPLEEYAKYVKD